MLKKTVKGYYGTGMLAGKQIKYLWKRLQVLRPFSIAPA